MLVIIFNSNFFHCRCAILDDKK